jgi:hypothetical protein
VVTAGAHCTPLSAICRLLVYPLCTGGLRSHRVRTPPALRSSATPETDRPAGHGKADAGIEQNSRPLVALVVDLGAGGVALDRLDALIALALVS